MTISFLWQFLFLLAVSSSLIAKDPPPSNTIVDPKSQISDFDARFEMAKILSHHKESVQEALRQYEILQKQRPRHPQLLLEIGRAWMGQGNFPQALQILAPLLGEDFLIAGLPSQTKDKKQEDAEAQQSIVPLADQIDEDHARLELASVLSHRDQHLDEALDQYQILLNKTPHKVELILDISRIYLRQKKYDSALSLLYPALNDNPQNANLLVEAAHAEQALGHAKQSQTLLLRALPLTQHRESVLLDYANTLMSVGSFYQVEHIYRDALKEHPHSLDLSLKLAGTLVSAERYEEAEGIYRLLLLHHPNHPKILEALANLKILEKEFSAAIEFIDALLILQPHEPSYLLLRANTFYQNECYERALQDFESIKNDSKALIGMGRTYQKLEQEDKARFYFQKAYEQDPSSIEAQFYLAGQKVIEPEFISQVIDQTSKPEDLIKWANVYSENGLAGIMAFYEAALNIDPDFSNARIGLADALSIQYRYKESIEHYLSLLEDFPENSKIMIAIARVLSWWKQYRCSFKWYDHVIALNPQDPVPQREKARAAYWGYFFDYSMFTYQELLHPTVDELLLASLMKLNEQNCDEYLSSGIDLITQSMSSSIYTGYEKLTNFFEEVREQIPSCERLQVEEILIEHLPLYRIQKSISLESYAKELDWQSYSFHALPVYQELADFSPGNIEGLYGYAQDFCSLGLCHSSRDLYYHILHISPNHNLVKMALERNLLKEHWLVQSNYSYWKERGLGQFSQSQIARYQFDEILTWNPSCNFQLRFMQNVWVEHPLFIHTNYYPAEGQTIEVDRNFNGFIKGAAGATRKNYFQRFPSRYTGFANLWFNCYDYFNLGVGFERKNEIYNYFSLKEGIQAKICWISVTSNLTHYWNMGATYRHLDYNDKNTMDHVEILTSYTFSDDPNVLKIILQGSYRNTAHLTEIITNAKGKIVTVIHPYWTPQHYYSNSITLEYRHNFAFFNYCEGPQRYLDIKLTGEEDSARNPSFQIACEWKHEFMYHFGFELKGFVHQSRLWNAEAAWVNVYYRF